MIRFPDEFISDNMEAKINFNRSLKLQEDRKMLRKKVFESFSELTEHFTTIDYTFKSDCTEEEIQESYRKIKRELEDRKFICKGQVAGKTLHLLVSVKVPKKSNTKWNRVFEKFRNHKRASEKKKKKKKSKRPKPITPLMKEEDTKTNNETADDLSPDLIMETGNMMLGGV